MDNFIVSFIKNSSLLNIIFIALILIYIIFELLMYLYEIKTKFKVNCSQLILLLNHNNAVIIDIRSQQEYLSGHITNAINIPGIIDCNAENPKIHANSNRVLIIVDEYGKTAKECGDKLRNLGIREVWYLEGGIFEWKKNKLPLINNKLITEHTKQPKTTNVVLYTKENCPYCLGAKNLLKNNNYTYSEIEVKDLNTKEYQDMVSLSKGSKTFPQIFINGKHIGGFQELKDLNDKHELSKMI